MHFQDLLSVQTKGGHVVNTKINMKHGWGSQGNRIVKGAQDSDLERLLQVHCKHPLKNIRLGWSEELKLEQGYLLALHWLGWKWMQSVLRNRDWKFDEWKSDYFQKVREEVAQEDNPLREFLLSDRVLINRNELGIPAPDKTNHYCKMLVLMDEFNNWCPSEHAKPRRQLYRTDQHLHTFIELGLDVIKGDRRYPRNDPNVTSPDRNVYWAIGCDLISQIYLGPPAAAAPPASPVNPLQVLMQRANVPGVFDKPASKRSKEASLKATPAKKQKSVTGLQQSILEQTEREVRVDNFGGYLREQVSSSEEQLAERTEEETPRVQDLIDLTDDDE